MKEAEDQIEPKRRKIDGQVERQAVNTLAHAGISKRNEQHAIYNSRRLLDKNRVPDHLRTMKFKNQFGIEFEEVCCWETDTCTLFGE